MGKKTTTTTKTTAPSKRAAQPAPKAKITVNGVLAAEAKPKPAKPKRPAAPRKPTAKTAAPAPSFTLDDVALRAYFISEKRRAAGLPGDEHSDWLEAERQLLAESIAPKPA